MTFSNISPTKGENKLATKLDRAQSEEARHVAECNYWIKVTGGDKAKVSALIERIAAKRGQKAADRLLAGMRDEYRELKLGAKA